MNQTVISESIEARNALEELYKNRNQFLIIGLTGRTGSGCSTVADLLSSSSWDQLPKKVPLTQGIELTNEDRKYRISYNFMSENWNPFIHISISDVILTFLLGKPFKDILYYLKNSIGGVNLRSVKKVFVLWRQSNPPQVSFTPPISSSKVIIENFEKVRAVKEQLRVALGSKYSRILQTFGDNIRKSGDPLSDHLRVV